MSKLTPNNHPFKYRGLMDYALAMALLCLLALFILHGMKLLSEYG